MKVKDLEDFDAPRRRPWLLIIVVVAVVGVLVFRWLTGLGDEASSGEISDSSTAPDVMQTGDSDSAPGGSTARAPSVDVQRALAQAAKLEQADDLSGVRKALFELLDEPLDARSRRQVEAMLGRIHIALALSPRPMTEKKDYIVRGGDSLQRIAKKFGTTVDLIARGNHVDNPRLIKVGDRYRILQGEFSAVVSKSRRELDLMLNGRFFKRYAVGIGKFGKTPTGTFEIWDKQKRPVWWRPDGRQIPYGDPENILGTRWMAVRATGDTLKVRGYGIHGTWDNASIGKAESAGCIRMRNEDVEELYLFCTLGMPVKIVP